MKKMLLETKKNLVKAGATTLAILMTFGATTQATTLSAYAASASVVYKVHGARYGWQSEKSNGALAGTTGQSLQLECITADLKGVGGDIEYRVHVQDYGWLGWTKDNAPAGTTGQSKRIEAIEMRLTGEAANKYYVEYRSHCQNVGWGQWVRNGVSGTTGKGLRMEAIQIRLVEKSGGTSVSTSFSTLQSKYPSGSLWNGSYKSKAWTCHGFACTLADELTSTDPYTWSKVYNLNSLKAGDIVRFSRPHSILITGVSGNTVTYVDCNWVGTNKVQWNQTCAKNQLTKKFGSLSYVMVSPK